DRAVSAHLRAAGLPEEPLSAAQALHTRGIPRTGDEEAGRTAPPARRLGATGALGRQCESAVSSQRRGKPAGCRLPHRDVQQPAQSSGLLPSITVPVDVTRNGLPVVNGSRFVTSRLKRPAPCEAMPGLAAIRFATMTLSVSVSS